MLLSKPTIQLLKNFAQIEESIKIHPGSTLFSLARVGNIFATATIEEEFEQEVNIYNLNHFLSALSLFDEPTLTFSQHQVVMKSGRQKLTYRFADPDIIPDPKKQPTLKAVVFSAVLPEDVIASATKVASVLAAPKMQFLGKNGIASFRITDPNKSSTANVFEFDMGETDAEFNHIIAVENFKVLKGEYTVDIPENRAIRLTSDKVTYYIAAEKV